MRKVVMGLSGGMDSATLLGVLLDEGAEVHCCHFQYGSKHNLYEEQMMYKLLHYYEEYYPGKIYQIDFDLTDVFKTSKSALLKFRDDIPEGHFEDASMKATVVYGRNLIFASIMASHAESLKAEQIALGVHAGDHAIYPDCRISFILELEHVINESTDGRVHVIAPFITHYKADILVEGYRLDPYVPYDLTRTCYKNQIIACGKCGSCQERIEAFNKIGKTDPLNYE